jgi:acyl-CoA thioester hydrolase
LPGLIIINIQIMKLRIDWADMDLFGHVNNVSFFRYLQASRVNYWEESGMNELFIKEKKGPLLANTSCKFIKPLNYPGNIEIEISVSFVKTTSFGLHHKIFNESKELCAEGDDVVVFFDYNTNQKIELTDPMKNDLNKYLES